MLAYPALSIPDHQVGLLGRSDLQIGCTSLRDADVPAMSSEECSMTQPIAPCLWCDGNAEEAVDYYV